MAVQKSRPIAPLDALLIVAAVACCVVLAGPLTRGVGDPCALLLLQDDRVAQDVRAIEPSEGEQNGQARVVRTSLLFWTDGMTVAPGLVFIHPDVRSEAGLLAHEAVHCRQMHEVGLLRFWWRYLTSPEFRLEAEAEAYRVSLRYEPGGIRHFARALAHGYLLEITPKRAELLLRT